MVLLLLLQQLIVYSQDYLKGIAAAFREGDAVALSVFFDKTVDLTFSDETNSYSKKQAEQILHKFFTKIEPKDFTNQRVGDSKYNNTRFCIGTLFSSRGDYKVYMFFLNRNGNYYLKELRFEK